MASEQHSRAERAGSFASSSAETATSPENEKLARLDQSEAGLEKQEDLEGRGEGEDEGLLPQESEKPEPPKSTLKSSVIWMVVNTLATIGIVCAPAPFLSLASSRVLTLVALRFSRTKPSSRIRR
jgi:solute carrier family 35 protein E3